MRNRDEKLTRRSFLRRMATAGAVTVGAGYLVACKPSGADRSATPASDGTKASGGGTCTDLSGLTEAEKQTRTSLGYVDKSTVKGKNCLNCGLYKPEEFAKDCGGCTVMKGPVMAQGYCTAWAAKAG